MNGGRWLFLTCMLYVIIGLLDLTYHFTELMYIQMVWIFIMSLPLWIPPMSRWCKMKLLWED